MSSTPACIVILSLKSGLKNNRAALTYSPSASYESCLQGVLRKRTESGLRPSYEVRASPLEWWWPGTELNRRRQPFQVFF